MDVLFAISSTSPNSSVIFPLMKNATKDIVNNYGTHRIRYAMLVFGANSEKIFPFNDTLTKEEIIRKIDSATVQPGPVNLKNALSEAKTIFDQANPNRPNSKKVLIVMTDNNTLESQVDTKVKPLTDNDIQIVGVGVGTAIIREQLDWLTLNKFYVIHVSQTEPPRHLGYDIMTRAIKGE